MVKPSFESALKEAYASCLPFHLIQHALGLEYNACKYTRARIYTNTRTYVCIYAHRASVTGIAPVRDLFVPRALSLSARFICTRIDISPVRVRIRSWSLSLSFLFLFLSLSHGASFIFFRISPIWLRGGVARSLVRYAFSVRTCVRRVRTER